MTRLLCSYLSIVLGGTLKRACKSITILVFIVSPVLADNIPLAEIPYQLINNRVQITAQINNTNLQFLLDTGASKSVIFETEKSDYSLLARQGTTEVVFPALDEIVPGILLKPFGIRIGSHTFTPQSALLIQRRTPVGDRLNIRFDGILGQDFFERYLVEVNPRTKIFRIYEGGRKLKKSFRTRLNLHMKGTAPHIKFINKLPWEPYPKPKKLLLDTGYPGSMVIWKDRHFRLAAGLSNVAEMKTQNIGIFTKVKFDIGTLRFFGAPVFIAPHEPKQAHQRDGLLGSNVLSQFHYAIDFQSRKLWLSVVGVHTSGIDGAYYLPNNENYIVRDFHRPKSTPVFIVE